MADRKFVTAMLKEFHEHQIGKNGIQLRIYHGDEYLGRLEMSDSGISAYSGNTGQKVLANLTWYQFLMLMATEGPAAEETQRYGNHA